MRFENTAMIWAFLAVALPLIIHFIFKRRYQTYTFGAMTVLRMALAKRKDRILLEQILLIGTRILLLACLAAAMLHPILGEKIDAAGDSKTCMVLLYDNSYSMLSGEGLSRLERAKFVGRNLMDALRPGDEAYIASATEPRRLSKVRPYRDPDDAKAAIQAMSVAWKPKDLPAAVRAAAGLFARTESKRRELFIFTDQQKLGFGDPQGVRWQAVTEELKKLKPAPRVFWVEPGMHEPWAERSENLVMEPPRASSTVVHANEPLALYVRVRNTSETKVDRADVVMELDGKPHAKKQFALEPKGQALARFTCTLPEAGPHRVSFQVRADEDLLAEDDTVLHAIQSEQEVSVLMVDGNLTPEPLHNESDLARFALSPPPLGKKTNLPYTVKVVSPVELHRMKQLRRKYAAILFVNVREPDEALVNRLEQYVAAGGGLLIALGDRVSKAYYNKMLYREGRGLLPCEILAKGGDEAVEDKFQVPSIALPDHPSLATLGLDEAGFENVQVRAWHRVRIPKFLSETNAVLKLSPSNDPLLLARRFGRGMLFVVTTGLNTKWSDFPIHPAYQLLVRGLVDNLRASQQVALNLKVGEGLRGRFAFDRRGAEHILHAPEREGMKLAVKRKFGADLISYEATDAPGFYMLQSDREGSEEKTWYAVNPDTKESDLAPVSRDGRESVAASLGARRVGGWSELESLFQRARRGTELWWILLACVVGFAVLEVALARMFTRSFVDESVVGK